MACASHSNRQLCGKDTCVFVFLGKTRLHPQRGSAERTSESPPRAQTVRLCQNNRAAPARGPRRRQQSIKPISGRLLGCQVNFSARVRPIGDRRLDVGASLSTLFSKVDTRKCFIDGLVGSIRLPGTSFRLLLGNGLGRAKQWCRPGFLMLMLHMLANVGPVF